MAAQASGLTRFTVQATTRHPADLEGYDSGASAYKPSYVNPPGWEVLLGFFPAGAREVREGHMELPQEIASYSWRLLLIGGEYSETIHVSRSSYRSVRGCVLPEPGTYLISLDVNLTDGSAETRTRRYRLRDRLVIGIGDSFAAGQGNPDAPAIPAPDQILFCRQTSVALVAYKARETLDQFIDDVGARSAVAIETLPYAGKVILAVASGVRDVAGEIHRWSTRLHNWTVKVGRDALGTGQEAIEEGLGWIGIGDGGESSEADPHPAAWQEPAAYRSYRSGQSLAAADVEDLRSPQGGDTVTFLGFGRTGAAIRDGLLGPRTVTRVLPQGAEVAIDGWTRNRGEVREAADTIAGRSVDALILTIGINDVGFSSLVTDAILHASGAERKERIAGLRDRIANQVPEDLDRLKAAIDDELHPRRVLVTSYPVNVFKEIADGQTPCEVLGSTYAVALNTLKGFDLDGPDARDFTSAGLELNVVLQRKAEDFGWLFVDGIRQGFEGHGYCSRRGSYFVKAEDSCLNQGDFEGMLHPNQAGHNLTRDCISKVLGPQLFAEHWAEPALHMMLS